MTSISHQQSGTRQCRNLALLSLGICVFLLLSLALLLFSLPEGIVSRNEGKKRDEGVVGRSEEDPDSRETMSAFAELVDSDLLRFASQRLMAFASLLKRYLNKHKQGALFLEVSVEKSRPFMLLSLSI